MRKKCGGDNESVKEVFKQFERLTMKSGQELNAEETEILSMHTDTTRMCNTMGRTL